MIHTHTHTHTQRLAASLNRCYCPHFTDKLNPRGLVAFPPPSYCKRLPALLFPNTGSSLLASLLGKLVNSAHKHEGFSGPLAELCGPRMGQPIMSLPRARSQLRNCRTLHLLQASSCSDTILPLSVPQSAQHWLVL